MFDAWRPRARAALGEGLRRAAAASTAIVLSAGMLLGAMPAAAGAAGLEALTHPATAVGTGPAAASPSAAEPAAEARPAAAADDPFGTPVEGERSAAIALADGGVLAPGDALTGTVVLSNGTDAPIAAGTLALSLGAGPLAGRAALDAWYLSGIGTAELLRIPAPTLLPGESREVDFVVAAADVPLDDATVFGAWGVSASWEAGDAAPTAARTALVWNGRAGAEVAVSTVVPLIAPIGDDALVPAAELARLTADDGALTRLLEAVEGRAATLAIDPRLLASIRALGLDAPASAREWLARLQSSGVPSFALEFADASLALQSQAGLEAPLEPIDFRFVTEFHEFAPAPDAPTEPGTTGPEATEPTDATESAAATTGPSSTGGGEPDAAADPTAAPAGPEATGTESAPGTPGPTGTEPVGTAPAATEPASPEALLAFEHSRPDLVWPRPGGLRGGDLERIAQWRPGTVLLAGDQVRSGAAPSDGGGESCAPQQRVGGVPVLVTDAALDRALGEAATVAGELAGDDALGRTAALVAVTATAASTECTLIAALPRVPLDEPDRLDAVLELLHLLDAAALAPLPAPAAGETLPSASLVDAEPETPRLDRIPSLLEAETRGAELSGLYDNPAGTVDELRVRLLDLLGANWSAEPAGWPAAADAYLDFATGALGDVRLVAGSDIQLIGHQTALPVFVHNDSDRRVTVVVHARPATGHLDIPDPATLTIEPNANARAQVPVEAIANGLTSVLVTLSTPDGTALPSTARLSVNINAQLEAVLLAVLGGAVVLLLAVGTVRMIRRRERTRARARLRAVMAESTASADEAEPAPAGAHRPDQEE